MTDIFFRYTNRFVKFTEQDKDLLVSALTLTQVPAKTELVSYNQQTDALYFLLTGCIRKYFVKDGEQITTYIMTENGFIGAFDSIVMGIPSEEIIECLEPCTLLVLKKADLDRLYQQVPLMNEFIRKVLEGVLIQFKQTLSLFILDNPEERYIKLLSQNPEILQRVPQHMLATYLGITATSLSRIRKRILEKA
ncbi:Crp/Fnr family transcriptional regulator [Cytophagaceae bacterium YF14B1]|uniref:Crp/Fnr family transcriptional regulator n=1 Tax=Xanthocytophaga flava TaxID=3048013 RepID=A0AAE3QNC9_9BACT|nr:Crp/Fnr family transcriptional regulator [Xanthocytophaga flavus]MDJ1480220.1 Crp/Fnr family transcriptional regulator [Xanthocytophaga flavus]